LPIAALRATSQQPIFESRSVAAPPQTSGSGDASIEGVVVKWGSGEPIAGAAVELNRSEFAFGTMAAVLSGDPNAPRPTNTITGSDGRFILRNIPAGNYRLSATLAGSGYMPAEYGQRNPSKAGATLTLASGQALKDVRLAMAPTGSISGRVFDADGEPIGR